MLILNLLPLIVFHIIDNKQMKEVIGFGFFYMVIWVLVPCLLVSLILYVYHKKNLIFERLEIKKHLKIVLTTVLSFLLVIINGFLFANLK